MTFDYPTQKEKVMLQVDLYQFYKCKKFDYINLYKNRQVDKKLNNRQKQKSNIVHNGPVKSLLNLLKVN